MPFAEVNGQRVRYEDSGGSGQPLVFSHGFLMDSDMFEPQRQAFGGTHRVITWDQRGHGRTVSDGQPFSYWDSVEDLVGLLDQLGVDRAVLGGMSQGGMISLRLALRHPERASGLVLIDTQAGTEDPEKLVQYDLMRDVWVGSGPNDQLLAMVAAIIVGNERPESATWIEKWKAWDPNLLAYIYRPLVEREDITDRLAEIEAPAVVIHGVEDAAIEMSLAERLCGGLRHCRGVVRVEGAGHASNLTHPDPVNRAIADFLS